MMNTTHLYSRGSVLFFLWIIIHLKYITIGYTLMISSYFDDDFTVTIEVTVRASKKLRPRLKKFAS